MQSMFFSTLVPKKCDQRTHNGSALGKAKTNYAESEHQLSFKLFCCK